MSPVRMRVPLEVLYASLERGCEPSGFTQRAILPSEHCRQGGGGNDLRVSLRVLGSMDQIADSAPVAAGRAWGCAVEVGHVP